LRYVFKKFWCQLHEDGEIKTRRIYVKDSTHKSQNSALVGVT